MLKVKNWKKFQHFKDRKPPWIKLHREILDQRDINSISSDAFKFLIQLWLLASEDDSLDGILPDVEDISFRLRITKSKCCELMKQVDVFLISDQHQSDRLETETYNTETELETETEQKNGSVKNNKGTRVPEYFEITDEMKIFAKEQGVEDVLKATDEFIDYWRGVPGIKGFKLDWLATWRNRMREYLKFHGNSNGRGTNGKVKNSSTGKKSWVDRKREEYLANQVQAEESEVNLLDLSASD